jgi:hypothetical protein
MTNAIGHPLNGSVVLRGVKVDLIGDIGTGFVLDCTRHIESLLTAEQLRKKYQLDVRLQMFLDNLGGVGTKALARLG